MAEVTATYRVQLHARFTFDEAARLADYFADLGISHLYCSPYLQATPGSMHGYDVLDHRRLNTELGGAQAHRRMVDALASVGLGHIVDIVPNHMAISRPTNRLWWDVLKHGRNSRYADFFDIDWTPPNESLHDKVLLPVLGDHYGKVLEAGDLRIERRDDEIVVTYHDLVYPLAPGSVAGMSDDDIDQANRDRDRLHELLDRQHYRLAFWRTAALELDYRRFFDVNSLVALRSERDEVFEETHNLVFDLVGRGDLDGLRIDHVDGLRYPRRYLQQLRGRVGNVYLIVEKILEPGESLRDEWPVDGTTGYEFLNLVGGLFVDPTGEKPLSELYEDFTGCSSDFEAVVRDKKLLVCREILASDVERLTVLFTRATGSRPRYRDHTAHDLRDLLRETIAAFPVYRSYVDERPDHADVRWVEETLDRVRRNRPDIDPELIHFLHDVLLLRVDGEDERELALRFQQTTGPVMAKGVEDTAFYEFNRLISLNEVGGDPARFGVSTEDFHSAMSRAQQRWPKSLVATSTHDTKRSEDVRARIALLSEIPGEWANTVRRWSVLNERHRTDEMPDRNTEYLLYQTLVGAHPLGLDRALAYAEKATKEAKRHTSWVRPVPDYDRAVADFVRGILQDPDFQTDLQAFVEPLVVPGRVSSLAQTALKLTSPGVPDLYQGTEGWDLSLVDPDNRRRVDHARLRSLLLEVRAAGAHEAPVERDDGAAKLFLTARALDLRRRRPMAFGRHGSYRPLPTDGDKHDHVVAFVRGGVAATVTPRLVMGLQDGWGDTRVELPVGPWVDVLSGTAVPGGWSSLADLLRDFPVALLEHADTGVVS